MQVEEGGIFPACSGHGSCLCRGGGCVCAQQCCVVDAFCN